MPGGAPLRELIVNRKTGRLTPVWEKYFVLTITPVIERILEQIPTNFEDGSIPFVEDGFLNEDNDNLSWNNENKVFYADGVRTKILYFGDSEVDGTWRIIPSGDNLNFEKREAGAWIRHGDIR